MMARPAAILAGAELARMNPLDSAPFGPLDLKLLFITRSSRNFAWNNI
jgi:hypothetical protein